jgi:hypothetical protein
MSKQDREMRSLMDNYMEEQRRLHKEVLAATAETKIAAATLEASREGLEKWTLSIQKRVEKLERWQALLTGAGIVAGAALWDKAKKVLGLT